MSAAGDGGGLAEAAGSGDPAPGSGDSGVACEVGVGVLPAGGSSTTRGEAARSLSGASAASVPAKG